MKRFLSLLIALLMFCAPAMAEYTEDYVLAVVNGEALMYSTYATIESAYLYEYEAAGVDLSDANTYSYLQDLALSYALEQMLVRQDMQAQGCYDFDDETEAWFAEIGKAAYNQALNDVIESMRTATSSEDELLTYALAYASVLGVTEQTYVDFYRTQYAAARYYEWLIQDNPITETDVLTAYTERVAASQAAYEYDVAAFETAMNNNAEVWYKPAGYRSILQILLPTTGNTDEEKLASVQATMDDIYARLEKGEVFTTLIAEYGADANFSNEAFLTTGYQVHQSSIIWEQAFIDAAFSAEMTQPGSWSQPLVSTLGVHILYYLCDSEAGPIALTDEIYDALASYLYTERYTAAQAQRINELADAANIVIY